MIKIRILLIVLIIFVLGISIHMSINQLDRPLMKIVIRRWHTHDIYIEVDKSYIIEYTSGRINVRDIAVDINRIHFADDEYAPNIIKKDIAISLQNYTQLVALAESLPRKNRTFEDLAYGFHDVSEVTIESNNYIYQMHPDNLEDNSDVTVIMRNIIDLLDEEMT